MHAKRSQKAKLQSTPTLCVDMPSDETHSPRAASAGKKVERVACGHMVRVIQELSADLDNVEPRVRPYLQHAIKEQMVVLVEFTKAVYGR